MSKQPQRVSKLSKEDFNTWVEYLATGKIEDEEHAKQLSRLGKREANLEDLSSLINVMTKRNDNYVSAIIERNEILERVVRKMGATDDQFREARAEYDDELKNIQEQVKKSKEELEKKQQEKSDENSKDNKVVDLEEAKDAKEDE